MPINKADRQFSDDELRILFTDPSAMPERPTPAYLYDEGADQTSLPLRQAGIMATTVQEQGSGGELSDYRILAHARRLGCTLIVNDEAYKLLHEQLMQLRLNHAGIIWIRLGIVPERVASFAEFLRDRSEEKEVSNLLYNDYRALR
jgi:hypothetical protein